MRPQRRSSSSEISSSRGNGRRLCTITGNCKTCETRSISPIDLADKPGEGAAGTAMVLPKFVDLKRCDRGDVARVTCHRTFKCGTTLTIPREKYLVFTGKGELPGVVIQTWGAAWQYLEGQTRDK